jgi:hypothetical protein
MKNGKAHVLDPIPLTKEEVFAGKTEVAAGCQLSFSKVPPGKYRLEVEIRDTVSAETATLQTTVEFVSGVPDRSNTPKGAKASAIIYSIIETAKEAGLNPHTYLNFLFEKLPNLESRDDATLDQLLPWNVKLQ